MGSSPDLNSMRGLIGRLELERLFGLDEVVLPRAEAGAGEGAAPSVGAPAAASAPPAGAKLSGSSAGEAPRRSAGTAAFSPRRRAPSEEQIEPPPAAAEDAEVIVVGSAGPETGDLFSDGAEKPGEGVPDVHSSGLGRPEALRRLAEWTLNCHRCPLEATRKNVVFGEGSPEAKLVFVGEAPGADEDATGRPFVGRAGQLLDKIITAMGLAREAVYICNVLKCRPPENRTPNPTEIAACSPVLREQLRVLAPSVIVALGSPAAKTLLGTNLGISKIRGRFHFYHGMAVMPTFHPAYLLRNPGEEQKRMVWEDMKAVLAKLGLEAPKRQPR